MADRPNKFVGSVVAFGHANEEELAGHEVVIEVTDSEHDGTVEIACDTKLRQNPRIYIRFRIQDLLAELMRQAIENKP